MRCRRCVCSVQTYSWISMSGQGKATLSCQCASLETVGPDVPHGGTDDVLRINLTFHVGCDERSHLILDPLRPLCLVRYIKLPALTRIEITGIQLLGTLLHDQLIDHPRTTPFAVHLPHVIFFLRCETQLAQSIQRIYVDFKSLCSIPASFLLLDSLPP